MMFKYKNTKKVIDMRFPVKDLSYCLYSGASKKELDSYNEYLKVYYESCSSFLRNLGSDPLKLFPFEILKEHWKKYSKFGMIISLPILKMQETKKEDIIDFSGEVDENKIKNMVSQAKFNEEGFKKRIKEVLQHMTEIGVL
ncbi:hypothetical protein Zmor_021355 [Zophobas morio]|uniref:Uncharacterized protein n=1 Tax=Zophobas morio TaxID=2755281 RepID=A0AA38I6B4_9CUCU|nr:hypothetical protein Zmor_021355 [Zophobas morio]